MVGHGWREYIKQKAKVNGLAHRPRATIERVRLSPDGVLSVPVADATFVRHSRFVPVFLMALAVAFGASAAPRANASYTKAEADSLQRKIERIVGLPSGAVRRGTLTAITEREVNAYLRYHLRDQVPQGITEPVITIMGDGRVSGQALVDLDAVSRANRSGSWFDPMRLLSGRLPVTALGTLETKNGSGRFVLESATVSGVPVPKTVLQQVVSYYSSTPEDADGIGLDEPFVLPAQIQEIRVQPGQAVVVQ